MGDKLLDKSLDALIEERAKPMGPKRGIKVKSGVSKVKTSFGNKAAAGDKPKIDMGAQKLGATADKKISKPKRGGGGQKQMMMVPGPEAFIPPPGYVLAPAALMQQMVPYLAANAGAMDRTLGGGGGRRGRGGRSGMLRDSAPRGDPDAGPWKHDMYDHSQGRPVKSRPTERRHVPQEIGTKIRIANIHHSVSADDINELFSTTGPLVSYSLLYDQSGRSTGEAEVVYRDRSSAMQAIQEYDNIALDGQKLSIKLVEGGGVMSRLSRPGGGVDMGSGSRSGGRGQGAGRMLQQALPRGMGDGPSGDSGYGASRRGKGPGPRGGGARVRSSAVPAYGITDEDMMED